MGFHKPIAKIYLMRTELSRKSIGIFPIHPPIDLTFKFRVWNGSPPIAISVPLSMYGTYNTNLTALYHFYYMSVES
jgi:hypothetical protein